MSGTQAPDLDAWLGAPLLRTHHRREASVQPAALWQAAEDLRVGDTPLIGRVLRWRIPGTDESLPYQQLFRSYPFTMLAEGDGWLVSGLCGRIWTLKRDYPRIADSAQFEAWREPGTVRVLFAHWVEALEGGGSEICSEARVQPVDRSARWRTRALWTAVGRFESLVGREVLGSAVRRSEREGARVAA